RSAIGPNSSWPSARPRRYAESVCCTRAGVTANSAASVGSAGRYMSIASGPSAITRPRTSVSRPTPCSAFDAEHLLERVDPLDEIGLVRHHLVDVLVGARDLVEDPFVLAADDALRLALQVLDRERLLRRVASHLAAGAV